MLKLIKRIVSPPLFPDDDDKTRAAAVLNVLSLSVIAVVVMGLIINPIFFKKVAANNIILFSLFITSVISRLLSSAGNVAAASGFFLSVMWLVVSVLVFLSGGIISTNIAYYIAITVMAGILLGKAGILLFGIISCAASLSMLILLNILLFPVRYFPSPPVSAWFNMVFVFILTSTPLILALNSLRNALASAKLELNERREVQKALTESEEKFRMMAENSADFFTLLTLDDIYHYVSPAVTKILGYEPSEMINKRMQDFIDPEGSELFDEDHKPDENFTKRPAVLPPIKLRYRNKNGEYVWIEASGKLMVSEDGNVQILNVNRDITDRKRAEDSLAIEKERLHVTLRSITDGVITMDVSGNIILMNPVAEELTGCKREVLGKSLDFALKLYDQKNGQNCVNPVYRIIESGEVMEETDFIIITSDGSERIVSVSGAPLRHTNREISGAVIVFRDITEKQRLMEAVNNAQKLESLGVLAGGIAHDFNNLLGGIFGYIDLARMNVKEKEIEEYLDTVMNTIDRARGLTRQLLTFSKGGLPNKKTGHLFPFVRETVQFALSGSAVSGDFEIQKDLWPADFDKTQIGQVVENIIINAQQAMPMGGKIRISAANKTIDKGMHPVLKEGRYILLSIRDSGIGIPREVLGRIFDPFFTTKQKGNGLGLASAYSIISKHYGLIEVESEPGKGTAFHIFLPASFEEIKDQDHKVPDAKVESGTVLIMDDEAVILDLFEAMIRSIGYAVIKSKDGKEALKLFNDSRASGKPVSAIVLDLTVPGGMGGMETIEEIRKLDKDIPAFVSSGYADDPVMADPARYGFTGSLSKPYTMEDITGIFARYLKPFNTSNKPA